MLKLAHMVLFPPSQGFDYGVVLNIMPEFKRLGRVE